MKQVLLLNASEEILAIISWQRAVTMLCSGKAHAPYNYNETHDIRTSTGIFKLPTAIVLETYVVVPYKRMQPTRKNVLRRDRFECMYCGKELALATCTLDHVHPTSKGGPHEWRNLVSSCKKCNSRKGDRSAQEVGCALRGKPFEPTREFLVLSAIHKSMNGSWKRWTPQK